MNLITKCKLCQKSRNLKTKGKLQIFLKARALISRMVIYISLMGCFSSLVPTNILQAKTAACFQKKKWSLCFVSSSLKKDFQQATPDCSPCYDEASRSLIIDMNADQLLQR